MTITLTPELEKIVNEQLAGGQFTSPEDVVRVSLQLLHQKYGELKGLIAESVEQARKGEVGPLDIQATVTRVKVNRSRNE